MGVQQIQSDALYDPDTFLRMTAPKMVAMAYGTTTNKIQQTKTPNVLVAGKYWMSCGERHR